MKNAMMWLLWSAAALAQAPSKEVLDYVKVNAPVVVLSNVTVLDGTGGAARANQTIVLSGGLIREVGNASRIKTPGGATVLDLRGRTVIPGLVGMHNHTFFPAGRGTFHHMPYSFPRLYLAGGVTTIRTAGTLEPQLDLNLKSGIDAGTIPGPRMHVTGPYLEGKPASVIQMQELTDPEAARATVNYWADRGATSFKLYSSISREVMKASIDAAHARKLKVTGDLCSVGFREAAALGIDNLEHGLFVDSEFWPGKKPDECPSFPAMMDLAKRKITDAGIQEMIRDLVAKNVAITSTLPVFELLVPEREIDPRAEAALSPDARASYAESRQRLRNPPTDPVTGKSFEMPFAALFELEKQFELAFVRAGGHLMAGLDPTGNGGVVPGFGDQRAVELLVEAGFTPLEAIRIATLNGAEFLGEAERVGSIAPGKFADLVVVRGDPSQRISDIRNVELVFKGGLGFDPAKLVEAARGQVGLR